MKHSIARFCLIGWVGAIACCAEHFAEDSDDNETASSMVTAGQPDTISTSARKKRNGGRELKPVPPPNPHAPARQSIEGRLRALQMHHGIANPAPLEVSEFIQDWWESATRIEPTSSSVRVDALFQTFNRGYVKLIKRKLAVIRYVLDDSDNKLRTIVRAETPRHSASHGAEHEELLREWFALRSSNQEADEKEQSLAETDEENGTLASQPDVAAKLMEDVSALEARVGVFLRTLNESAKEKAATANRQPQGTRSCCSLFCCFSEPTPPASHPLSQPLMANHEQ